MSFNMAHQRIIFYHISCTAALPHIHANDAEICGWDNVWHEGNELVNIRRVYMKRKLYFVTS